MGCCVLGVLREREHLLMIDIFVVKRVGDGDPQ